MAETLKLNAVGGLVVAPDPGLQREAAVAGVVLDPNTRAPSASWSTFARVIGAALVAKLALWLTGWGVELGATDQVAIVAGLVALGSALGKEARDRNWMLLKYLLVLPLVISLAGCATWGETTPSKVWSVALTSYERAARGMAAYCAQPDAERDPCVAAARATEQADLTILVTKEKLQTGTIADAELAVATATLRMALPLLTRGGE